MRRIASVLLAASAGCAPQPAAEFAGEYLTEASDSVCRHHHPDAIPFFTRWYLVDPFVIEEPEAGLFALSVPLPPCALEGRIVDDELHVEGDDCSVEVAAAPKYDIEAHSIEYSDIDGVARWEDGVLVVAIEAGRRYSRVLGNLPQWWDDPGSCTAEYRLTPVD